MRALSCLLVGLGLALVGENIVRQQTTAGVPASVLWYGAGIALAIIGTWGTYRRGGLTAPAPALAAANVITVRARWRLAGRWALTGVALVCSVASMQVLRADWMSMPGMLLYLAGVGLLVVAWVGDGPGATAAEPGDEVVATSPRQRRRQAREADDAELTTDWRMSPRVEIALVVLACLVAVGLRLYGLGDLDWGMHGDEGEAASEAFSILDGKLVSPFTAGWFAQPNVYYWSVAISLKVFGMSLAGLRMSSVIFSVICLPFFYLLVRRMFGVRTAFIALGVLVANMIFLHYGRVQFSNVTTPVFWMIGFYFLVRGLQTRRMLDFVLAAFASFFSLYFYNGARILPFLMIGLFAFMAVFEKGFLRRYPARLLLFGIAAYVISAPFVGYYLDNTAVLNARSQEKLIYNNMDGMRSQYGDPQPLNLGVTQVTVPPQVHYFWGQLTRTLSMFTYRHTESSVLGFTLEPLVNAAESALLVLGLAIAIWRWRDPRFAFLLIWFWGPTLSGSVLTIEAPYFDRMIGALPTLIIFMSLVINKVIAEGVVLWRLALFRTRFALPARRVGLALQAAVAVAIVAGLGLKDTSDYFGRYLPANWVVRMGIQTLGQTQIVEERPNDKFYEMGEYRGLNFDYGITRFFTKIRNIDGRDLTNLGTDIPFLDSNGRDVTFIVNGAMNPQLNAVKEYYPSGEGGQYLVNKTYGAFTYYMIPKEQISATQQVTLTYQPLGSGKAAITARVRGVGSGYSPLPPADDYPLDATWEGGLVAPDYAAYYFRINAPGPATFKIDGRPVLTSTQPRSTEGRAILARGVHSIELKSHVEREDQATVIQWKTGDQPWSDLTDTALWNGPLGGLLGEMYPAQADSVVGGLAVMPGTEQPDGEPPISRRIDSVMDWRDSPGWGDATGKFHLTKAPVTVRWRGTFVAPQGGTYTFETFSNGDSGIWIDDQPVVQNTGVPVRPATPAAQNVELAAGEHSIEVRYNWFDGDGAMVMYVTEPGKERTVANGTMFKPVAGVWLTGGVSEAPVVGTQGATNP